MEDAIIRIFFDTIPTYGNKSEKQNFSGRRIKRGLYQARDGRLLNADVNGAINIGRKEFGDEWFRQLLELDGGVASMLRSWNIAKSGGTPPRNLARKCEVVHRPCETARSWPAWQPLATRRLPSVPQAQMLVREKRNALVAERVKAQEQVPHQGDAIAPCPFHARKRQGAFICDGVSL